MFDLSEFLIKNEKFDLINPRQYIAFYINDGDTRKYLTKDNKLTTNKDEIMIKQKYTFYKLTNYLETMDKLNLSIEEYDAYQSSDCYKMEFRVKECLDPLYDLKYFPETDEWYSDIDGVTRDEREINEHCLDIVNKFTLLPVHHLNHRSDVCRAIHDIQRIMQSRICHRLYPDTYPIKNGKVDK